MTAKKTDTASDVSGEYVLRPDVLTVWTVTDGQPDVPPDGFEKIRTFDGRSHGWSESVTLVNSDKDPVRDVNGQAATLHPGHAVVHRGSGEYVLLSPEDLAAYLKTHERVS